MATCWHYVILLSTMHNPYLHRLKTLKAILAQESIDAALFFDLDIIFYFSGFTGSAGMLLVYADDTQNDVFVSDPRYAVQAKHEVATLFHCAIENRPLPAILSLLKTQPHVQCVGLLESTPWGSQRLLQDALPGMTWVTLPGAVGQIRMCKDAGEMRAIRKAISIAESALRDALSLLRPGVSEQEVAAYIEYGMKQRGAEKPAFDTIVASGVRSARPHGVASQKRIRSGNVIVIDCGARYRGYHSDLTRTFFLDKIPRGAAQLYQTLLAIQKDVISRIKPGIPVSELDTYVREVLATEKLDHFFTHSLGHGVGVKIHEAPGVASASHAVLAAGMVITIEPGLYLPNRYGMRIEDMVCVTETGHHVLTHRPKSWDAVRLHSEGG